MESMSEKDRRINQQYAPIDAKINSIPCETYALDGVEYPKASGFDTGQSNQSNASLQKYETQGC